MIANDKPLVSIITPCYNGEEYVHRFLDSILNQTYEKIELIFVNDGSKDRTGEIVLSYQNKFEKKGIIFKYIYQENKGQAAALNRGLKIFEGDYLTWPDSDDILHKDNILKRVEFLEKNKEYNIVLCNSKIVNKKIEKIGLKKRIPPKHNKDNLFNDLIKEKNAYFAGGAYMFRTTAFVNSIPNKHIFESRGGQNWQMLLPVVYNNKCGYLDEELYFIYERKGSHSRQLNNFKKKNIRTNEHEDILINTITSINEMPKDEKKYWINVVKNKYLKKRYKIAVQYKNKDNIENLYKDLKAKKVNTFYETIIYYKEKNIFLYYIYQIIKIPAKLLFKIKRKIL